MDVMEQFLRQLSELRNAVERLSKTDKRQDMYLALVENKLAATRDLSKRKDYREAIDVALSRVTETTGTRGASSRLPLREKEKLVKWEMNFINLLRISRRTLERDIDFAEEINPNIRQAYSLPKNTDELIARLEDSTHQIMAMVSGEQCYGGRVEKKKCKQGIMQRFASGAAGAGLALANASHVHLAPAEALTSMEVGAILFTAAIYDIKPTVSL